MCINMNPTLVSLKATADEQQLYTVMKVFSTGFRGTAHFFPRLLEAEPFIVWTADHLGHDS